MVKPFYSTISEAVLNKFIEENKDKFSDILKFKLDSLWFQVDRCSEGVIFLNQDECNTLSEIRTEFSIIVDSDKLAHIRKQREEFINSKYGYEDFITHQLKDIAHYVQYYPVIAKDLFYNISSIGNINNECDFVKISNNDFFTFIECYMLF